MARIVCIEDEAGIREDIVEEITDAGHEVIAFVNGKEGLQGILEYKPDLVICDCLMPVMTGEELIVMLRKSHPQFKETPFLVLSAHADKSHMEEVQKLGADAYLTKPFDFDILIETVEALLEPERRQ